MEIDAYNNRVSLKGIVTKIASSNTTAMDRPLHLPVMLPTTKYISGLLPDSYKICKVHTRPGSSLPSGMNASADIQTRTRQNVLGAGSMPLLHVKKGLINCRMLQNRIKKLTPECREENKKYHHQWDMDEVVLYWSLDGTVKKQSDHRCTGYQLYWSDVRIERRRWNCGSTCC